MPADILALRASSAELRQLIRPSGSQSISLGDIFGDAYHRCHLLSERLFREVGPTASMHICLRLLEEFLVPFKALYPRNRSYKAAIVQLQRKMRAEISVLNPYRLKRYGTCSSRGFASKIEDMYLAFEDVDAAWGCRHTMFTVTEDMAKRFGEVLNGKDLAFNLLREYANDPNGWAPHCRDIATGMIVAWGHFEAERIGQPYDGGILKEEQRPVFVKTIAEKWEALATVFERTGKSNRSN